MPKQSKTQTKKRSLKANAPKKTTAKKMAAKKTAPKKAAIKKTTPKKAVVKKATPKKTAVKKTTPKKTAVKKTTPKKTATRKAAVKNPRTRKIKSKGLPTSDFKSFIPYSAKRGEMYMGVQQRQHFKEILAEWKGQLMQEVDRTVSHMKDDAANFPDPADRATQEEEFSLELRTRDRERKLIKKIDETMEKIDQDDYGFCEACGIEIGIKRLEARPTATLCIDCKTLDEIKERQELG